METLKDLWKKSPLGCLIGIVIVLGFLFGVMCLEGWLITLLWNSCLVEVFPLVAPMTNIWQAVGLECLCMMLLSWRIGGGGKK